MKEQQKNTHFRTWKSGKTWLYASAALVALAAGAGTVYAVTSGTTIPATDVYAGASTGTATLSASGGANFGGEAHASASLSAIFSKNIGHSPLSTVLGVPSNFAPATPVASAATVLGDAVTNPIEYFLYNHTAQAISATASAGVIASQASALAWQNSTASNVSLAAVAQSAATEASSLTQLIVGSLASLEVETSTEYSNYQAAVSELAANGSDASYANYMSAGNSAYAQVDVWGGHSTAVSNGNVVVSAAAGSSLGFSVSDVASAYHSAGLAYGLEGVQAVVGSELASASSALAAMTSTAADVTTGATTNGNIGQLGLYAQDPVQVSEGATLNFAQSSTFNASSAFAGMSLGNAYASLAAFYTDYYETAGSNGKFENLVTNGVLNASASLAASGSVDTSKPGTYPVTFTLSIPSDGTSLAPASVTVDYVVGSSAASGSSSAASSSSSASSSKSSSAVSSTPVYRLYNAKSGEHFYTTSLYEANSDVQHGFTYENIAWSAPKVTTGLQAVYRLYNKNSGEHFYTESAYEKNVLVKAGWSSEGIAFYSAKSGVAVYRAYNPNSGQHLYTTSAYEVKADVKAGWKSEGIAFYGIAGKTTSTVTVPTTPAPTTSKATTDVAAGASVGGAEMDANTTYNATVALSKGTTFNLAKYASAVVSQTGWSDNASVKVISGAPNTNTAGTYTVKFGVYYTGNTSEGYPASKKNPIATYTMKVVVF